MKISVIIPVYNVEQYVRRCLESVIMQDNGGADIECILVDDCGKDRSMEIVRQIVADYQGPIQFVLLAHEHNRGLSAARNTGIDAATGDYILFVDSDDWLLANAISKFVDALERHPYLDMVIGRHNCKSEDRDIPEIDKEILFDNYQVRQLLVIIKYKKCSAWNKIARIQIVKNNKFHEGIIFEDIPWCFFCFKDVNYALLIPEETYKYECDNSSSIIHTAKTNIPLHVRSINYICNVILDAPYQDMFADSVLYIWDNFYMAYRLQYEQNLEENECQQIRQMRNRIIRTSFKRGRWFVALYVLFWTPPPTSYLFNFRYVRRHHNVITKNARKIAFSLEKLHHLHGRESSS